MSTEERGLSRRERQIMDTVYRLGRATAAEVRAAMPDAPSDSAVRTFLRILEEKGHLRHEEAGARYVYLPVQSRGKARKTALARMVETFFAGSPSEAVAALLGMSAGKLSDEELDRREEMVKKARKP
ncbi:MAG: BlaI/MecI/CopY family transcriptional regulator [Bryobacteraceae bacterium]|nr:BlaI/MecI/CopY family transcriptional regulator [Bryobacteraceae bacterium]